MKIILFSDQGALKEKSLLIFQKLGIEVVKVIITKNPALEELPDADALISLCYHYKVSEDVLANYPLCINFHPAPLPAYKGFAVYNFGIYNEETFWGVSAHHMTSEIDEGDIIKTLYFNINKETVESLRSKSHENLLTLMEDVLIDKLIKGNVSSQVYPKKSLESLREINSEMSSEEIAKRIRSCHFPPHEGAYTILKGHKFIAKP